MNLRKLENFILIVEKRNFSEVAAHLHCSQPAVSRQIKSLEEDLNISLIDRYSSGIIPTPAGEFLYRQAKEILKQWKRIEVDIQNYHDTLSGRLVIGTSTIPGTYLMPRWIRIFRSQFPNVAVSLEVSDSEKVLEKLEREKIDMAIVGVEPSSPAFYSTAVASDKLVVIAPVDHPLCHSPTESWERLKEFDFVLREEGSGTRKAMEEYLQQHGASLASLRSVLQVGNTEALIAAVEEGVGISCVSHLAAIPAEKSGRIKIIDTLDSVQRTFYLSVLEQRKEKAVIKEFISKRDHLSSD
ncbi:selenium metabolism-associated LysR family transcriptional regulator [Alteribacillus sp. JSM 102045]|uniref:selenium metabolism-associated LysR family transcriptional regulator n=1 Tax=Alteribacillus sp. JSM 102045 TaxID=1562101 RepID=UPI0035BFBAC4